MKIILVKPRGFCAGVKRAVETVNLALKKYPTPIYVRHQIVHNERVVSDFNKRGVIFIEDLNKIPKGARVIFSAHGVSPVIREMAKKRNLKIIDATCPLVNKVHFEVKKFLKEGYTIVLIGHKKHVEVEGTIGEASGKIQLISNINEIKDLNMPNLNKIAVLTQTTLNVGETGLIIKALKKKYPKIIYPPKGDICYATTNRQKAVKILGQKADLVLIVGSKKSSNSNRLLETAVSFRKKAFLINSYHDIKDEWLKNAKIIGISSGASVPEVLINEIIEYFKNKGVNEVKELEILTESVVFGLPLLT